MRNRWEENGKKTAVERARGYTQAGLASSSPQTAVLLLLETYSQETPTAAEAAAARQLYLTQKTCFYKKSVKKRQL